MIQLYNNTIELAGGPSAAEFTGRNYLQILIAMLAKESEPHKLRLVGENIVMM